MLRCFHSCCSPGNFGRTIFFEVLSVKIPSLDQRRIGLLAGAMAFSMAACSGESTDGQPSGAMAGTGATTGAGGAGGTGGTGGACDPAAAMAKGCGTIACHGGVAPPLLELIAPGVETRLINVPATYEAAEGLCPPTAELLIDTADPMASLLVKKLDGTQMCGDPMPQLAIIGFTDADKACIRSWALELAMNGSGAGGTTGAGGMPGAGGSGGVGGSGGSGGSGGTGGSGGGN